MGFAHLMTSSSPLLAIAATFTAEPLAPTLAYWMRELEWPHEVQFAPYGQVFQSLLDPASLFFANRQGVNAVLVRAADWAGNEAASAQFADAVESYAARATAPLIVAVCPPSERSTDALVERLHGLAGVTLIGSRLIEALYPVEEVFDPTGEQLGKIPYTPAFYTALATALARTTDALLRPPHKVIVLDCDNTLWQGTAGEDGPENVVVDPARMALQEFMVAQQQAGALLCLCSKNNEEDVRETFRLHPEMPLTWQHLVAWRINWESKGPNLASLAQELNLGLDSFVFLDDDSKECGEVQASCPAVVTLPLPHQAEDIPHFLRHVWVFDRVRASTAEDRQRTASYQQSLARQKLAQESKSLVDFLRELKLEVRIGRVTAEQVPRVAQLTQRTNQMNTTTIRRNEGAIRELLQQPEWECLAVEVCDRFGDYGLVGVMLGHAVADAFELETFLLSCRALGRGVEHRMVAHFGRLALQRGAENVRIPVVESAKNQPARAFLQSLGGGPVWKAAELAAVTYRPAEAAVTPAPSSETTAAVEPRGFREYGRIARELSRVSDIAAQVQAAQMSRVERVVTPARSPLEAQLAALWAELLHLPAVGIDEDFFDLGGHSLLAVQLLARVKQTIGVEVPLDVVYSGTLTVAELAQAVELQELGPVDQAEYAALLAELEGLSEEEVQRLLEQEQD